jgi:hypothetical protein
MGILPMMRVLTHVDGTPLTKQERSVDVPALVTLRSCGVDEYIDRA